MYSHELHFFVLASKLNYYLPILVWEKKLPKRNRSTIYTDWRDLIFIFFRLVTVVFASVWMYLCAHIKRVHYVYVYVNAVCGEWRLSTHMPNNSIFVELLVYNIHFEIFPVQVESLRWVLANVKRLLIVRKT